MSVARQRVLIHQHEAHPVEALTAAASAPPVSPPVVDTQPPVPNYVGRAGDNTRKPAKVPVNYRLDPEVAEKLREGSLTYSAQQGQRVSQNAIVEIAVRDWLIAHDLWDRPT
jgi:hypothetical protein